MLPKQFYWDLTVAKIMVVGGAGYIGSRLCPYLADFGHEVTVVDLLWFGYNLPIDIPLRQQDAGSLTVQDLEGFDQVIFIAGMSNDPMADFDPKGNYVANAAIPAYLATIAARAGVKRFIHGSSCSVYGMQEEICSEKSLPLTRSPYGVSKLMAEYGVSRQEGSGMDVINLRQGTVAGWSPRMRFDLVVNSMVKTAMFDGYVGVFDPTAKRPLLTLSDACEAYKNVVEAPNKISGTFNVVTDNAGILDIGKLIVDAVSVNRRGRGTPARLTIEEGRDIRSYSASALYFSKTFGWKSKSTIIDAAQEVITNIRYVNHPEDERYYNIQRFKSLLLPLAA